MTESPAFLKAIKLLPALIVLVMPKLGEAGEFAVRNCANRDVPLKVKSFNSTDTVRFVPAGSSTIRQGSIAYLRCATPECRIEVEYTEQISPQSQSNLPTNSFIVDFDWVSANYITTPSKRYFCLNLKYKENGAIASSWRYTTGTTSCSCS
ncbi:hypothetical protein T8K17_05215 [Thalassobaculum sp. OXR-137]|uniref:hypothetical protein n=1 Tax=Thalassobaculum sp. OXR-137 TaxID=3100173 RepID=UPI002AC966A7|nr:hypothetical protein [Thalassobaculum sp. OXR-137]WPZ35544.1 hypothetical protein T8K17_05215 [Thalassobaculum sp. OXR-137]